MSAFRVQPLHRRIRQLRVSANFQNGLSTAASTSHLKSAILFGISNADRVWRRNVRAKLQRFLWYNLAKARHYGPHTHDVIDDLLEVHEVHYCSAEAARTLVGRSLGFAADDDSRHERRNGCLGNAK